MPEPSLGNGIYKIDGLDADNGLIWSGDGKYLAGSKTVYPWLDCPVSPIFCAGAPEPYAEIFIVDTKNWGRRSILKTESFSSISGPIAWFPDSEHIAYILDIGGFGQSQLWSIDSNGQNNILFMEESGNLIWHPDGTRLALSRIERIPGGWHPIIKIIDTTTKKEEQIFKGEQLESRVYSLSWSADGKILAFSYGTEDEKYKPKANIFFFDQETMEITQLQNEKHEYWSAAFSPKGTLISLQHNNGPVTIKDLNTNCEVDLPIDNSHSASWSPDGKKMVLSSGIKIYLIDLSEFLGTRFKETGSVCAS